MARGIAEKTVLEVQLRAPARTKGGRTRERILDLAEDAVMHKGFAATSIDELVDGARIGKSTFFYHFRDKNDLARQLIERYLARDEALLDGLVARARALSDDPLQSFLIFLRLFTETMADLKDLHPGCLVAAITYQDRAFDREVCRLVETGVRGWRGRFHAWLAEIAERYPPRLPVDLEALADHLNVVVDGAIITSRALREPAVLAGQARLVHDFVKLLFDGR
jgi:AcrR family transcriptional regulator